MAIESWKVTKPVSAWKTTNVKERLVRNTIVKITEIKALLLAARIFTMPTLIASGLTSLSWI